MGQIYMIRNLVNKKVYIGQTHKNFEYRYGQNGIHSVLTTSRNEHLKNSIKKYGTDQWEIKILEETNSREELNIYEDLYILQYKSTNRKYGYNKKTGGDSWEFTEETKEKMRLIKIELQGRKVICLNTLKIYDSVSMAAKEIGDLNPDNIRNACKGRCATAYGLKWEYYDENNIYKLDNERFKPSFEKMVVRLNDRKVYDRVKDAADDLGVCPAAIVTGIKKKSTVKNDYQFAYFNQDIPLEALKPYKNKAYKMVMNLTTGKIYDSVKECAKSLGVKPCTVTSSIKNYKQNAKPKCAGNELQYIDLYDIQKEVINVDAGRIYRTINEASSDTGISGDEIYKCIIGEILDIDDEHWDYYENGDSYWLNESSSYSYKYKPVININTNEIFSAVKFAVRKYEIDFKAITSSCVGETYEAAGYQWAFWEKDKTYELKEIRSSKTQIRCITTGEIFETLQEAADKYNVVRGNITMVCQGNDRGIKRTSAGIHPETGEPLKWEYIGEAKTQAVNKAVRCKETGVVYRSLSHAQEETGIQKGNIRHVCNGTRKKAGNFTWEYVDGEEAPKYDVKEIRKNPNEKEVLCLNDGLVHKNISSAAKFYGIKTSSNLSAYLTGKNKTRSVKKRKFVYFDERYNFVITPEGL